MSEYDDKPVSFDDTPRTSSPLAGLIAYEIDEIEPDQTSTGKLCIKAVFRAIEPEDVEGRQSWKTYTIGTKDDPQANDPLTFGKKSTIGFREFRDLIDGCQISKQPNLGAYCRALKGQQFDGLTRTKLDKETGDIRSEIKRVYKRGEKPLYIQEVSDDGKMGPPITGDGSPVAAAPAAAPGGAPPPPPGGSPPQ